MKLDGQLDYVVIDLEEKDQKQLKSLIERQEKAVNINESIGKLADIK